MKKLQTFERKLENNFINHDINKGENPLIKDKFNKQITTLYDLIESATLTIHSGEEETPDLDINYVPSEDVSIGQFLINNGIIKNLSKRNLGVHKFRKYNHMYINLKKSTNVVDYLLHENVLKAQNENDKHIKKANVLIDCINNDKSDADFYMETTHDLMTVELTNINFGQYVYTDADYRESEKLVNKGYEHSYYTNKDLIRFTLTLKLNIPVLDVKLGIKNLWSRWDKCFQDYEILSLCTLDVKRRWISGTWFKSCNPLFNNYHVGISELNNTDSRDISFKLFVERALAKSDYQHKHYLWQVEADKKEAERKTREQREANLAVKTIQDNFGSDSNEIKMHDYVDVTSVTQFTQEGWDIANGFAELTCITVTNELGNKILLSISEAKCGIIEVLGYVNPNTNNCVSQDVVKRMFNQTSVII